jgi:hypothetical protein
MLEIREIVVAMAIADGGRLPNRCGDGPVRWAG